MLAAGSVVCPTRLPAVYYRRLNKEQPSHRYALFPLQIRLLQTVLQGLFRQDAFQSPAPRLFRRRLALMVVSLSHD